MLFVLFFSLACDSGDSTATETDDDAPTDDDSGADDSAGDDDFVADDSGNDDDVDDDSDDDLETPYEFAPPPSDDIGVFVATTGDDANPGTMAAPKATFAAGVVLADETGKAVFIAEGEYFTAMIDVRSSVFGGYAEVTWERDIAGRPTMIVVQENAAIDVHGSVSMEPILVFEGVRLVGQAVVDDSGTPMKSSGVWVNGGKVVFSRARLVFGASFGLSTALTISSANVAVVNSEVTSIEPPVGSGPDDATGIYCNAASAVIVNSKVSAGWSGADDALSAGIVLGEYSPIVVVLSEISGGILTGTGSTSRAIEGGGSHSEAFDVTVADSIIDGGTGERSVGISLWGALVVRILNTNIWGSALDCLAEDRSGWIPRCADSVGELGGFPDIEVAQDVISVDPMYADETHHLSAGSPCVDTGIDPTPYTDPLEDFGDMSVSELTRFDFEDAPRPYGSGWDIGPDEWTP